MQGTNSFDVMNQVSSFEEIFVCDIMCDKHR